MPQGWGCAIMGSTKFGSAGRAPACSPWARSVYNGMVLEKEKEILKVQAINEGKPEAIAEKMVQGRIKKFYKENCLMDQEFIKDGDQTIKSYTEAKAKELGGKIEILSFVRYEKGEGIEKRNDDFASEVASMMK